MTQFRFLTVGVTVVACAAFTVSAQTRTFDGNNDVDGGDGVTYTDANNWDTSDVPNSAGESAVIDPGDAWDVLLNGSININGLTVGADDTLTVNNGSSLSLAQLTADGTINVLSTGNATSLVLTADQIFTGSGQVVLSEANARLTGNFSGRALTLSNGFSVTGSGNLGFNILNITNNGTVSATSNTTTLVIDPSNTFINDGTLEAVGTAGLELNAGTFVNNTSIDVLAGSALTTTNGTIIQGGSIDIDPTAQATFGNGTDLNAVTINGTADVDNGDSIDATGGLTVNDTLNLNGTGNATQIILGDDQTFGGTGQIVMDGNNNTRITGNFSGRLLTVGNDLTIEGSGNLGNNVLNIINNGAVRATSNTDVLTIDPNATFANNGTLAAVGTAGLDLNGGTFVNNTSIDVLPGSALTTTFGTVIQGGAINVDPTGQATFGNGTDLNAVTINGIADVSNGDSIDTIGGLTVNGTVNLNGSLNSTQIILSDDQAFGGNGQIVMTGGNNTRITGNFSGRLLTIANNMTIRGSGNLGVNVLNIINNGAVRATSNTNVLAIDPNGTFTNNGTLEAVGTAGLDLNGGTFINNTSIDVLAGSTLITSAGTVIQGGTINVDPTGQSTFGSGTDLNAVTINGTADVNNNNSIDVISGLTVNGALNVNGAGNSTQISLTDDQTFDGAGQIVMIGNSNTRITGNTAGRLLTIANGFAINGSGFLGVNVLNFINNGAVRATSNANTLSIDPHATFTNNGTLEAVGSAGLDFNGGTFINNTSIDVLPGSILTTSNGTVIQGGSINVDPAGQASLGSGTDLNAVTITGPVDVNNGNSIETLTGLTVNGTLALNGLGSSTQITLLDDHTFDGTGQIVMTGTTNTRITGNATGRALTIANGLTIRGSGNIGTNVLNITNHGTILADGASPLAINTHSSFVTSPTSVLGGDNTFDFVDGFVNNNGTIAPGNSPGTLTIDGDVNNSATSVLAIEIAGATEGVDADLLVVNGYFDIEGTLEVTFLPGAESLLPTDTIRIVNADSFFAALDSFDNLTFGDGSSGFYTVTYDDQTGDIFLTGFDDIVVPEPTALAMIGLTGLALLRRRQ